MPMSGCPRAMTRGQPGVHVRRERKREKQVDGDVPLEEVCRVHAGHLRMLTRPPIVANTIRGRMRSCDLQTLRWELCLLVGVVAA